MARVKQATPIRREVSSEFFQHQNSSGSLKKTISREVREEIADAIPIDSKSDPGVVQLAIAVGGIYASL